ncbi:MAG: hypothetical protein M0Q90_12635 [Bacteroidales bacterium]|nr:hypothetical protein [Bacteroidales bacterium]
MFKIRSQFTSLLMLFIAILILPMSACKKDDDPARQKTYDLKVQDVLGVSGVVTFIETSATATTIKVELFGAPSGSHPVALYSNTIAEGGNVIEQLNPVDASGVSTTLTTSLNYSELIAYNGFIRVVKSSNEPHVILAQGDIGGNVLTDVKKTYTLKTVDNFGVSGTAVFQKRLNGSTLVTISLTGTIQGETYPASINLSTIETIGGGPVTKTLSSVNGTTGKSYTTIRKLDSGLDITYEGWLLYNGYINIYQTSVALENVICHGNIGSSVK